MSLMRMYDNQEENKRGRKGGVEAGKKESKRI